jgi:hypothetical protein
MVAVADPHSFHVDPDPFFYLEYLIFLSFQKTVQNSVFFSESVFRSSKGTAECGSGFATLTPTF